MTQPLTDVQILFYALAAGAACVYLGFCLRLGWLFGTALWEYPQNVRKRRPLVRHHPTTRVPTPTRGERGR